MKRRNKGAKRPKELGPGTAGGRISLAKLANLPVVLKDPEIQSRAMKVHPSQAREANNIAEEMGCGSPFRRDGMCVLRRSQMKRYIGEINRRRGEGEARMVNFDGGHGDPT